MFGYFNLAQIYHKHASIYLVRNSIRNYRTNIISTQTNNILPLFSMTVKDNLPPPQMKRQFKLQQHLNSKSHIYACFQQPQTIEILKYITQSAPNKLLFDSTVTKNLTKGSFPEDDKSNAILKRVKEFRFQKIYNRQEKFKFAFSQQISAIISQLFKGYSQTVFIYGTEESKKDKILIGESQNAGLLLTTLNEMFEYCHEKEIEDQVTIKISCSIFKDGKFVDPFSMNESHTSNEAEQKKQKNVLNDKVQDEEFENIMCEDMIEGKYLLGSPQIIIRNMRTALKIINLITKKIQQRRDMKEQNTENLIFTIKLELDTDYDRQSTGEVYEYCIPKLHIVKLANPSIDNTLNGVNKNNKWIINLFNFLQNEVLLEKGSVIKKTNGQSDVSSTGSELLKAPVKELTQMLLTGNNPKPTTSGQIPPLQDTNDAFTEYIRTVAMRGVADIHCFTSINNKMTSNECLTAFIFNNYLSVYQTKPQRTMLNIQTLKNEKKNYEEQLMNLFTVRETEDNREKQIVDKYRAKYRFTGTSSNSNKGNENSFLKNASNTVFGKSFTQTQKIKLPKQNQPSPRAQRPGQSHSLKKQNPLQMFQTSYNEANSIKQNLKSIIGCDDETESQEVEWQVKLQLLNYIESVKHFMNCFNLVEYEYAQILSHGCERLNKYIFNEEIEEFYYAKKISLEHSLDLKLALKALKTQKIKMNEIQDKIMKIVSNNIKKTSSEMQILKKITGRQQHQEFFNSKNTKIITMAKQKDLLQKIFDFYNTMSFHFIYEDNQKLATDLQQTKKRIGEEFEKKVERDNVVNYEEIMKNIKKGFNARIKEMRTGMLGSDGGEGVQNSAKIDEQSQNLEESILSSDQPPRDFAKSIASETSQLFKAIEPSKAGIAASMSMHAQKKKDSILQQLKQKASKYKMRKTTNQLDNMFTNSNVGVIRSQFQRKNYL